MPGVLQFMGSQRVRHNWANELNWSIVNQWYFNKYILNPKLPPCSLPEFLQISIISLSAILLYFVHVLLYLFNSAFILPYYKKSTVAKITSVFSGMIPLAIFMLIELKVFPRTLSLFLHSFYCHLFCSPFNFSAYSIQQVYVHNKWFWGFLYYNSLHIYHIQNSKLGVLRCKMLWAKREIYKI